MEKIKADVQEKGDLGLVAEVCSLLTLNWSKIIHSKSSSL